MLRYASAFLLVCVSLCLFSCGEDSPLSGSQCEIQSCDFDKIVCQRYSPPTPAIIVHYKRVLEEGERWTAKITIDLQGLESAEGQYFEYDPESPDDNEFTNRVSLSCPDPEAEQWPEFDGKSCEIKKGGDATGEKMSGECNFAFQTGFFLTAKFNCTLQEALPP